MKKIFIISLCLVIVFALTGCSIGSKSNLKSIPSGHDENGKTTYMKVDIEAVRNYDGYGLCVGEKGEIKPLDADERRIKEAIAVSMAWADLTSNRSYKTITGDEEYHLYTDALALDLINNYNDVENTRLGHVTRELITTADNITVPRAVILPNGVIYTTVEYDSTLVATNDPRDAVSVGWETGAPGEVKHDIFEFELKSEDLQYKIYSFNNVSEWKKK